MPLSFRAAERSDTELVTEIVRAAYARWVPVIGREPLPMRVDYGRAIEEHTIHVAEIGPEPVGLIETILNPDHLWIENVAVRPERQGAGIGRQLLAFADDLARADGRSEIRLLTNGAFASNLRLYRSVGFVITHEEPFMDGMTVYMTKAL